MQCIPIILYLWNSLSFRTTIWINVLLYAARNTTPNLIIFPYYISISYFHITFPYYFSILYFHIIFPYFHLGPRLKWQDTRKHWTSSKKSKAFASITLSALTISLRVDIRWPNLITFKSNISLTHSQVNNRYYYYYAWQSIALYGIC
jgi:hypothetical protein